MCTRSLHLHIDYLPNKRLLGLSRDQEGLSYDGIRSNQAAGHHAASLCLNYVLYTRCRANLRSTFLLQAVQEARQAGRGRDFESLQRRATASATHAPSSSPQNLDLTPQSSPKGPPCLVLSPDGQSVALAFETLSKLKQQGSMTSPPKSPDPPLYTAYLSENDTAAVNGLSPVDLIAQSLGRLPTPHHV